MVQRALLPDLQELLAGEAYPKGRRRAHACAQVVLHKHRIVSTHIYRGCGIPVADIDASGSRPCHRTRQLRPNETETKEEPGHCTHSHTSSTPHLQRKTRYFPESSMTKHLLLSLRACGSDTMPMYWELSS